MTRRELLGALAAAACLSPRRARAAPFPVHFRKPSPHELLAPFIQPGADAFPGETAAMELAAQIKQLAAAGRLPLPTRHRQISPDVLLGEIGLPQPPATAQPASSNSRFYVLPFETIRYEIQTTQSTGLDYRVGLLRYKLQDGKIADLQPVRDTIAHSPRPLFRDVTADLFGAAESFREQLLRGVPYWRARLDSASGIDIYGNQGIAVGDIDDDGQDEIYVCQPGGLPNRLYQLRDGHMQDITDRAGVGLLDDTSCALFLDLRNIGRQDLVVLRASGPVLFLNQGDGTFALRQDAFHFQTPMQGSFTGMSAADFDRDGRLDLYLCTYTYFQSEDQYRYPAPYHDAQNGPPNFLFRNQLKADGSGTFVDVTATTGMNQNNNRFSFAPAWCDFDGDGWPDLYVANDFGQNNLYKNHEGRFHDIAAEAYVEDMAPGMSATWFDFDDDGRPDLYISNMWSEAGQRVVREPAFRPVSEGGLREPYRRHTKGNSLYKNRGDGTFADASEEQNIEMGRWAWSSDAFDFDNDRSPEIFITCGMLTGPSETDLMSFFWRQVVAKSPFTAGERSESYENGWNAINQLIREDYSWNGREPNVYYARRNGAYHDLSGVSGLDCALDSRAFAVTDFDGDGNLDILLKSRLGPQVKAFQNDCTNGRRAIAVRLVGTKSNRDAIGARVDVDGHVKFLQTGSGYVSQHTKVLYFGLGMNEMANAVRIWWPSGAHQEFRNLAAGYRYEITEGSVGLRRQVFRPHTAAKATSAPPVGDNQPRVHDTWLLEPVPLPDRRKGPGLLYIGEGEAPNVPATVVNLRKESADVAAGYALFRRYLLDWRTALVLPLALLIDEQSRVHKLYAAVPDASTLSADLERMRDSNRRELALPFHGDYLNLPRRNYFKLGAAFYWAGYPDLALPYLEETVKQSPENDKALNAIGQIHLDAGRFDAARPYLERAVAANPHLGEAWNNLGGVDAGTHNLTDALTHYQRAIELLPKAAYPLVNAGEVQAELGDSAAATKLYQRAMEVDPTDAEAPNQLGMLAAKENRNAEAKDWFQKAITLKRDYAGAINNLGVLYLQMGQTNDAIAAFEYGIKVVPGDELLYMNLGRTYIKMNDRAKARDTMLRLLQQKPDSAAATKALRELENR